MLYDPVTNYDRVKGKVWDWARDPDPGDSKFAGPLTFQRRMRKFRPEKGGAG